MVCNSRDLSSVKGLSSDSELLSSRKPSLPEVLTLLEILSKLLLASLTGLNGNDRDLLAIWRGCLRLGKLLSGEDTTIFALCCAFKSNDAGLMAAVTVSAGIPVCEAGADRLPAGGVTGLPRGQTKVGDSKGECWRHTIQNILGGFSAAQNPTSRKTELLTTHSKAVF